MDRLDQILKDLKPSPPPADLASRIMMAVDKRAGILERRKLFLEASQLAIGMTAMIYGFTALVLNFLKEDLINYINAMSEQPSMLATYEGAMALMEQLPIFSACLFFGGLVYSIRHLMLRGIFTRRLSNVMAGLFVVVAFSAFVGGVAVGSSQIGTLTANASSVLFQPFVTQSSDYLYSTSGEVVQVESLNERALLVTLRLSNGDLKEVEISLNLLKNNNVIEEGDLLYVLGKPDKLKDEYPMKAKLIEFKN